MLKSLPQMFTKAEVLEFANKMKALDPDVNLSIYPKTVRVSVSFTNRTIMSAAKVRGENAWHVMCAPGAITQVSE